MNNKVLSLIIAVAISIIFIGSLVPSIMSASDSIASIASNDIDGAITYDVTTSPDIEIMIDSDAILVNEYSFVPDRQTILCACDTWVVFAYGTETLHVLVSGAQTTVTSASVQIKNNVLSYTDSAGAQTLPVSGKVIFASNENYTYVGYTRYTQDICIDDGKTVYFFGNPSLKNDDLSPASFNFIGYGSGTIDSMQYRLFSSNITDSSISFTSSIDELGHNVTSNRFTASATNSVGTYAADEVYGIYVPVEYHTISTSDSAARGLIAAIPLILIAAVVILAVGIIVRSR